jgi:hypothetical protein
MESKEGAKKVRARVQKGGPKMSKVVHDEGSRQERHGLRGGMLEKDMRDMIGGGIFKGENGDRPETGFESTN